MLNPITELSSRINSNIHIELANNYWGLNLCNPNQVWNYAKQIHDSLESLIQGRLFFDDNQDQPTSFTDFDFVAYAYLQEELINTGDSQEVKYLKQSCPKLMGFVSFVTNQLHQDQPPAASIAFRIKDLPTIFASLIQRDNVQIDDVQIKKKKLEQESEEEDEPFVKPLINIVTDQVNLNKLYACVALSCLYCFITFAKHPFN